jgi:hypothetical protein
MTGTTSAGPSMSTTMCASRSPSVTIMVSQGSRRMLRSRTVPAAVGSQKAVPRLPGHLTVYGPVGTA